jgi:Mg2+/citrate symporter
MDKIAAFAAIFFGIFVVVFVSTFLWGVGRRIVRWALIAVVAYAAIIAAVRAAHLDGDGAAVTMAGLLSATLSPHCSPAESTASRSSLCTHSTK